MCISHLHSTQTRSIVLRFLLWFNDVILLGSVGNLTLCTMEPQTLMKYVYNGLEEKTLGQGAWTVCNEFGSCISWSYSSNSSRMIFCIFYFLCWTDSYFAHSFLLVLFLLVSIFLDYFCWLDFQTKMPGLLSKTYWFEF